MLKQRVLTTLVALPLLVAAVWFDVPVHWFTVFIVLWGAVAAFEFYRLVGSAKIPPLAYFGVLWAVFFIMSGDAAILSAAERYIPPGGVPALLLATATVLPLVWLLRAKAKEEAFARWAWTVAGVLYLGVLLGHLVALRAVADGRNWVFFVFLTTIASDSMAFFIGRRWGRHKLAPAVSPGKTWEGAVGGVFGAAAISLVFLPARFGTLENPLWLPPLTLLTALILAILVSVFGQLGDLAESLFKRNTHAKDSGRLLPGHGGALDRIDSVVFAGVVVYYYAVWLMG